MTTKKRIKRVKFNAWVNTILIPINGVNVWFFYDRYEWVAICYIFFMGIQIVASIENIFYKIPKLKRELMVEEFLN